MFGPCRRFKEAGVVSKKNCIFPMLVFAFPECRADIAPKSTAHAKVISIGVVAFGDALSQTLPERRGIEGINLRIAQFLVKTTR